MREKKVINYPSPTATGCSIQYTCEKGAGVEKGFDTDNEEVDMTSSGSGNQQARSRHIRRLKNLKAHHDVCERCYDKAQTERFKKADQCSSDSDCTILLDPTPDVGQDTSVPELKRAESVCLHRQMLRYTDYSLSSSDSSEEVYVPSADENDDDSSEDSSAKVEQHKERKRKAKKKNVTNTQAAQIVQPHKRRRKTRTVAQKDDGESSSDSSDVKVMTPQKKPYGSRLYKIQFYKSRVTKKSSEVGLNYPHPAKEKPIHLESLVSDDEMPLAEDVSAKCQSRKGSSQTKRKKWSEEEVLAVEKTLMDFIMTGKVPGKAQCLKCIQTSSTALQDRSWEAVKFYVKNRIDAQKRESLKQR